MSSAAHGTVVAVSRNDMYSFSKPVRDEITLLAGVGVEGDVHAGLTVRHRGRVKADPTQPNLRQVHLIQGELFDELREQGYEVAPGQLGENVTTRGIDLLALPRGTILRFGPLPAAVPAGDAAADNAASGARLVGDVGATSAASGARLVRDAGAISAALGASAAGDGPEAVAGVVAIARNATLDGPTADAVAALVAAAGNEASLRGAAGTPAAVVLTGLRNPCVQINGFRPGLLKRVLGHDEEGNLVRRAGVMGVVLRGGPIRPGDPVGVELPLPPHLPLERV
jgi:MOSC domain-containing protein YiiM